MTNTTVTLADLPQILKQLAGQSAAQEAQLAFYERELETYLKRHKALDQSPVSVQSRVAEALRAFEHEQKRFVSIMRKQTGRSVTLFWQQQLLLHELEMARANEEHLLYTERTRVFDLAHEKIYALLPKAVSLPMPNLNESGGRLAVTLSHAQGETLLTAKRLLELEDKEEALAKQWIASEVSLENAFAATSLSDFETYVMDWTLGDGHIPDPRRSGGFKGIGMGVLAELDQSGQQLFEQTRTLEQDVVRLREAVAHVIDLAEHQPGQVSPELLQGIAQLFQKYDEALPKARFSQSQPMPF